MAWTTPQYDRAEVNKAGRCLIAEAGSTSAMERDHMLDVINNWRSSHSFPLQCIKMVLIKRSKSVDEKAIVAQRLKRLLSIDAKLRQHSAWMKLTQMQDIGGCRAIVRNVHCVERIVDTYRALEAWRISLRQLVPKGVGKDTTASYYGGIAERVRSIFGTGEKKLALPQLRALKQFSYP